MKTFEQLQKSGALAGVKVLSLTHVIAGPMAASLLGDFGAEVVHVEQPGKGDPAREMGHDKDGVYVWWKVAGRNKRSLTLDLKTEKGAEIARRLAAWADVVITNMRPSALDRLGLSWEALHQLNPKLVYLQISGYGRDGPRKSDPGFGKVGEAMSGVVHITGFPDGPPVHTGFSHADAVTGLMGAYGVMLALYRKASDPAFDGELVDLALFEPLFRLIEWQVIGFDQLGKSYERTGNRPPMASAAVVGTYQTRQNEWVTVTSGTTAAVTKVVRMLGLPEEKFCCARQQSEAAVFLDATLRDWLRAHDTDEALQMLKEADVVASRIYSVSQARARARRSRRNCAFRLSSRSTLCHFGSIGSLRKFCFLRVKDMVDDPVFQWREDIVSVEDAELGTVRMQSVFPKLKNHGGQVWRTGPALGEDNELVLREWLRMDDAELLELREQKVI